MENIKPDIKTINFVFCAFNWFPFGGLTRDMEKIARNCIQQGHKVKIFVAAINGCVPNDLDVKVLATSGSSNHKKNKAFENVFNKQLKKIKADFVVGFNKMKGLDAYYAADSCFATKPSLQRVPWLKFLPRYRTFIEQEKHVFDKVFDVRVLMISYAQISDYMHTYQTQPQRFYLLPPGISKHYIRPSDAAEIRLKKRNELNIDKNKKIILFVGSGFKTKGLDRALSMVHRLIKNQCDCVFLIVGDDNIDLYQSSIKSLGIESKVQYLGPRDDVSALMLAADLLIHPAYRENTGTVLLEAAASALPVITTDVCGYAKYIKQYQLGEVVEQPYAIEQFVSSYYSIVDIPDDSWVENAQRLLSSEDIFSLHQQAANYLIDWAQS